MNKMQVSITSTILKHTVLIRDALDLTNINTSTFCLYGALLVSTQYMGKYTKSMVLREPIQVRMERLLTILQVCEIRGKDTAHPLILDGMRECNAINRIFTNVMEELTSY